MATNVSEQVSEMMPLKAAVQTKVASNRMAYIDNLRVFLTILVPLLHLAITYGGEGSWFYAERPSTELAGILLTLFVALCQFFFMGLFFLISGYFVPGSLERKGSWKYIKDRLIRLGIPLVLFSLLVSPFLEYTKSITVYNNDPGNLVTFLQNYWKSLDYTPGPMWFVEVLLAFNLIYVLVKAISSRVKRFTRTNTIVETPPDPTRRSLTNIMILVFILVLAPQIFFVRIVSPIGNEWEHIQMGFMPQYSFMFIAGILIFRLGWLPELPIRVRKIWSGVAMAAILALPVLMLICGATEDIGPLSGGVTWQSALICGWEAIYTVAMAVFLLSVFHTRLDHQGILGRSMSKNAYSVYIIHPLIIVPVAYLVRNVSLDPLLKFILVAPVAVALCFIVSQFFFRRIPLADKVL